MLRDNPDAEPDSTNQKHFRAVLYGGFAVAAVLALIRRKSTSGSCCFTPVSDMLESGKEVPDMDQIRIGKFIASCRKEQGMTQAVLAEKLGISDRAVSKWETGKAMPDSGIMLELCGLLKINVNELLSGERLMEGSYDRQAEENLLAMKREIEEKNRQMLRAEFLIVIPAVTAGLVLVFTALILDMPVWARAVLIALALAMILVVSFIGVGIEQKAGYYECPHCRHRYVPTYWKTNLAPHKGRTRYMRCPACGKRGWQKKVLTKDD